VSGVTSFPVALAVEHDQDAATVVIVAIVGESRFGLPHEQIALRPEHNNPLDALRIIMNPDIADQEDYDLTGAGS
jgi:hypothetical protein